MIKTLALLATGVLLPFFGIAQITINKTNMPVSGDTIRYSTSLTMGKTAITKTGANQSWDFTDLGLTGQGINEYISSSKTPYLLNFGFTAIGQKLADTAGVAAFQFKNIYNFYRTSNANFTDIGIGFQFSALPIPQMGKHTDPDEIYTFPLDFGDIDTTTFAVKVPLTAGIIPLGNFFRSGTRINIVDGWGKISTPYANNVSCIRVKSIITEYDSIAVTTPPLSFGQPVNRVEYKWLATTERIPILVIVGTEIGGTFIPNSIQYRDHYRATNPPSPIVIDFAADNKKPVKGNVVNFTNFTTGGSITYVWEVSPGGDHIFVNGTDKTSEEPRIIFNKSGKYTITLHATLGPNKDSLAKENYIEVFETSGVDAVGTGSVLVYPNPAFNKIQMTVQSDKPFKKFELIDEKGIFLYLNTTEVGDNHFSFDTTKIAKGTYFIRIINEDDSVYFKKIVIP